MTAAASEAGAPRLIAADGVEPQPWKNGGGRTRELLAWPSATDWRVRISVAEIERDGPFSSYPGVERWFAVLEGAGVELALARGACRVAPGSAPLRFHGAEAPACALVAGPTRDLNLMLRGARGRLVAIAAGATWQCAAPVAGVFVAAPCTCRVDDGAPIALPAFALLWFERAPDRLMLDGPGFGIAVAQP